MSGRVINSPGLYDIPEAEYHGDPVVEPSLSNSVAKTLITRSPRHARHEHPRLTPDAEPEKSGTLDMGAVVHELVLGGSDRLVVIDADDWRTKAAKEARDEARRAGMLPLLREVAKTAGIVREALFDQLRDHECAGAFESTGHAEQTVVWQEGGIWCRARPDWMEHNPRKPIFDLKTTTNADPEFWTRQLFQMGYDFQAEWYSRGEAIAQRWKQRPFCFVAIEYEAPFGMSAHMLEPAALAFAKHKADYAIRMWGECLRLRRWPGYPARIHHHEAPPWAAARWDEREEREKPDRETLQRALEAQRPMDAA